MPTETIKIGNRLVQVEKPRLTPAQRQVQAAMKGAKAGQVAASWNVAHLDNPDLVLQRKGRFATSEKSRRTLDDTVFDSRKEMMRYAQLKTLQRAGRISDLTLQPSWLVQINGQKLCTYTADSSYFCHERNRAVIEEVKSSGTAKDAAYRLRRRAAELTYGIRIDEVVM
jgi:hypothetical protein